MKSKIFGEFTGLDLRRLESLSDEKSQRVANNVYFTAAKKVRTRPGTRTQYTLPAETIGLYTASGVLRTVCPDRGAFDTDEEFDAVFTRQTPKVFFDFYHVDLDDPDQLPATGFINAERFGVSITAGVQPYGVLQRPSAQGVDTLDHQWFKDRPDLSGLDSGGRYVDNQVATPFSPTGMVLKLAEKLWCPDQANGAVRFSSTNYGPDNWTEEEDAGFLPVLANTPGDHVITGLGVLQSTGGAVNNRQAALIVFFEDGVQIWAVDPSPLNHYLTGILDGPGTENYRSIANVLGDPFFFSRRGFRSLRISSRTGSMDAYDIGDKIEPITDGIEPLQISAAVWHERIGCYLCSVGSQILCLRYDPIAKITAWSIWEMPWTISDMAIFEGNLWCRDTENRVHEFIEDIADDDGEAVVFEFESQYHHMGTPGLFKNFQAASIFQQGTSDLSYRPEPTNDDVLVPVYTITGVTRPHEKVPIVAMSDSVALRFTGTGSWQLDGYSLDYQGTGV